MAGGFAGVRRPRLFHHTWQRIADLAWPVVVTGAVRATMRTVDLLVLGMVVGPAAVAAVGIADVVGRVVLQTALGLGAGAIALASQHHGAGHQHEADVVATQSAVLGALFGLPLSLVGWWVADDFFRLLGADEQLVAYGAVYLRVVLLSAAFRVVGMMLARAFQGTGDTRSPMVIRLVGTGTNILLTIALVVGPGPLPALGVLGAAVGTAVGNTVSGVAFLGLLVSRRSNLRFARDGVWAPDTARTILRIGLPQVVERNVYALGDIPLNAILLTFGTAANAGFHIGRRVQQYARMPSRGGATASSALVGNKVGEHHPEEGDRYGRGSLALTIIVSGAAALLVVPLAGPIAQVFVDDPATIDAATTWIRVLAIGTVFRAAFAVLRGALQAVGDTQSPLYATVMGVVGFALLFSYVFGVLLGMGIVAVYIGVTMDYVVRSVFLYHRYNQGLERRAQLVSD